MRATALPVTSAAESALQRRPVSEWSIAWQRLRSDRVAVAGGLIVLGFVVVAILAPLIAPYDPYRQELSRALEPPSLAHPFGRDENGRDVLSRIIYGAQASLTVGVLAVGLALLGGVPLGILAGYYGRGIDNLIMRTMDVLLAFPGILLAVVIVAILGPSLINAMFAVALYSVPTYARLVRGSVLTVRELDYVTAARATGAADVRILTRHVLPNVLAPVIVHSTLRVATVILTAASLSFLGLGAQPPSAEWGAMLSNGRNYLRTAPHTSYFAGSAIMLVVLGFNLFGDGLRDALDPRLRKG
ncbi:MAG: ABC transporter permease [Chloroflexi bacterium]|nr:ABC transporter permease [Chloroflexota bacterium]